jgi:N-acetylglucosamine-6-sulfatase
VLSRRGRQFIAGAVKARAPFMLELSTFAPHDPYTPAPRDARRFPEVRAPRDERFDAPQFEGAPEWLSPDPLRPFEIASIDRNFRQRVRSVQAIDKLIGDIRTQLRALGVAKNTYIVFSSDNGLHMGQRRLQQGKQTYWDEDVRVPLVVVGPGVRRDAIVESLTANVDLRPTFQELAGVPVEPHVEGRSLAPLLRGQTVTPWRIAALIEHVGLSIDTDDPDAQPARAGNPPSYTALRLDDALFVAYDDLRHPPEYYEDPLQQHNTYATLEQARRERLGELLARLHYCTDGASCHAADAGS